MLDEDDVMNWYRALPLDQLPAGSVKVVRPSEKAQIAVFHLDDGTIDAIDNRCPHEGYPLSTGALKEGVLTCEWHNWKFRLNDGACILGGEDVRHYPIRTLDGAIWLDLSEPEAQTDKLYASLLRAMNENDWGHAGRTVQRLLLAGQTPHEILAFGCDWTARHSKYGFEHGLATAADLAEWMDHFPEDADLAVIQALSLLVEPHLRRPAREFPAPEAATDDVQLELRRRIEAEDQTGAEALFIGALESGATADAAFEWLTHAATDHFLDFGHAHIYAIKAEELIGKIGWTHAQPVLTSLVSSIVFGTREDRLPYMKRYRELMDAHTPNLDRWSKQESPADAPFDVSEFLAAILGGPESGLEIALNAVAGALDAKVAPARIARALALAASHRLWRFDPEIDLRDDVNESWLYITHTLTHADAVHETLLKRPSADALRALFMSARFIHHLHVLDLPQDARSPIVREEIDRVAFERGLLSDVLTRPIFVAHQIKTGMAALRIVSMLEGDALFSDRADVLLPLMATQRFLSHSHQERRVLRSARFARRFVREGKMHEKLVGY